MRSRQVMVVLCVLLAGSVVLNLRQLWRGREVEEEKREEKVEKRAVEKEAGVKVAMPEIDFSGTGLADGVWQLEEGEKAEGDGETPGLLRDGEMEVPDLVPGGREE
jgi:hypothetical protein